MRAEEGGGGYEGLPKVYRDIYTLKFVLINTFIFLILNVNIFTLNPRL